MNSARKAGKRRGRHAQSGYMLLVILLMVALLVISLTAAAPRIAQEIKRERENEMIHRGAQYARAIKKFYHKFGRYPTSLEQLQDTNDMRFLRKLYADPMSKDGKWKLLHPGDLKLAGGGNVGTPVSALAAQSAQPKGLATTNPTGNSPGGLGGLGQSTSTTTTGGQNAQLGGFIIGVASTSNAEGIHQFDGKSKYSEWYFIYDPTVDRGGLITGPYTGKVFAGTTPATLPGATPAGQQPGGFGRPFGGNSNGGFGQPFGHPTSGSGPIGTPPTPPKQ